MKYKYNKANTIKNIEITYNISIEETYLDSCAITLIFKDCYHSCSVCSLSIEESNSSSHNCINCKENYYIFPEGSSNCFSKEEMNDKNITYFLNQTNNVFYICNSECLTCDIPNEDNTVLENLFKYKSECLTECPNGTDITYKNNGQKTCQDCSANCDIFGIENTTWLDSSISNPESLTSEIISTNFIINNTRSNIDISYTEIEPSTKDIEFTESDIKTDTSNMIFLTTIN